MFVNPGTGLFVADIDDPDALGRAALEDGIDVSAHDPKEVVNAVFLHDTCSEGAA
jgi:hypothetical protein